MKSLHAKFLCWKNIRMFLITHRYEFAEGYSAACLDSRKCFSFWWSVVSIAWKHCRRLIYSNALLAHILGAAVTRNKRDHPDKIGIIFWDMVWFLITHTRSRLPYISLSISCRVVPIRSASCWLVGIFSCHSLSNMVSYSFWGLLRSYFFMTL